ncbi:MAG: Release factor glutamine methyltransferase [Syntrophorhabdus sp. PtaU1.Bin058]|nr:MAG: Release factor glutamine methyltransferase [Syntrophorhabdus sp. PtaU1.Bin058]
MFQNVAVKRLDAINIISLASDMKNEEVLANQHRELDGVTTAKIKGLLEERARGKPLAYITKKREFFSEEFYVDERVLIPRPETELLVEEGLKIMGGAVDRIRHILDMGTGSGAIGAVIAKKTRKEVLCVDISIEALRVAQYNARRLNVSGKTGFLCSDLFNGLRESVKFDMVIANLPYVAADEWDGLMEDVRRFEPKTALLGGREGTEIYERFIEGLPGHLAEGGHVLCEIGGSAQAAIIGKRLMAKGFTVISKRDLSGIERVLIGTWTRSS